MLWVFVAMRWFCSLEASGRKSFWNWARAPPISEDSTGITGQCELGQVSWELAGILDMGLGTPFTWTWSESLYLTPKLSGPDMKAWLYTRWLSSWSMSHFHDRELRGFYLLSLSVCLRACVSISPFWYLRKRLDTQPWPKTVRVTSHGRNVGDLRLLICEGRELDRGVPKALARSLHTFVFTCLSLFTISFTTVMSHHQS